MVIRKRIIFTSIIIFLILSSCNYTDVNIPQDVEFVIDKSENNRSSFIKTINHYKKDSLKLKALYYLISNMENKTGRYYDKNMFYIDVIKELDDSNKVYVTQIDSLLLLYKTTNSYFNIEEKKDIDEINEDILIENIDYAFKVWREKPWAKHLNFDEFCEWILPYRVYDEPLQQWRKYIYDNLSWLEDSLTDPSDPKEAVMFLNEYISKKFKYTNKLKMPYLGGNDAWDYPAGECEHGYELMTMACRSIGIPVSIDFTFQLPNWPGSHSWMVLLDTDKTLKPFNGTSEDAKLELKARNPMAGNRVTTIYRNTYAKNNLNIANIDNKSIPKNLVDPFIKRVTGEYKGQEKGNFSIPSEVEGISTGILYSFTTGKGSIAVSYVESEDGFFNFNDIGYPGYYYLEYIVNKKRFFNKQPFYWNGKSITYLLPDYLNKQDMVLYRKYRIKAKEKEYINETLGSVIQASNDKDFNTYETLLRIDSVSTNYKEIILNSNDKYRYYKYLNEDSSSIHLAEINLYKKHLRYDTKLFGDVYGYISDSTIVDESFYSAFDGSIKTNFNAPPNSWLAIDTGESIKIESIEIIARNHLNIIEPEDEYELFFFDKGWKSAGRKTADYHHIEFHGIPFNTLYLLSNITQGSEERIFKYENGKQLFK